MEKIHILPTENTPEILLDPKGIIKIKGRAIDEDVRKSPEQVFNWIDEYLLKPADVTEVSIALEYLNSFNTIALTSILKKISKLIRLNKTLIVRWYYEEDDEDLFERGQYISSTINIPIEFIIIDDIAGK
jgi:hypothetical protein